MNEDALAILRDMADIITPVLLLLILIQMVNERNE